MRLQTKYLLIQAACKFSEQPDGSPARPGVVPELLQSKGFWGVTDDMVKYAAACDFSASIDYHLKHSCWSYKKSSDAISALPWELE